MTGTLGQPAWFMGGIPVVECVGFPLTLEVGSRGLPKKSWLKISQVRTPSAERIGKRIGRASPGEVERAVAGLNEIIGT